MGAETASDNKRVGKKLGIMIQLNSNTLFIQIFRNLCFSVYSHISVNQEVQRFVCKIKYIRKKKLQDLVRFDKHMLMTITAMLYISLTRLNDPMPMLTPPLK